MAVLWQCSIINPLKESGKILGVTPPFKYPLDIELCITWKKSYHSLLINISVCLDVFAIVCPGGVVDRVFLLQVPNFICFLEVLVRGCKCKPSIQTGTVWLLGVQVHYN